MAKRWDYSNWNLKWTIIGCSCICPWWQVGLYCAGFPCKPFSYLNAKSRLLKEKQAKPLYQVIRHLKTTAPAVPCLLVSNWHKIILFDLSFFAGMHLRQFYGWIPKSLGKGEVHDWPQPATVTWLELALLNPFSVGYMGTWWHFVTKQGMLSPFWTWTRFLDKNESTWSVAIHSCTE